MADPVSFRVFALVKKQADTFRRNLLKPMERGSAPNAAKGLRPQTAGHTRHMLR